MTNENTEQVPEKKARKERSDKGQKRGPRKPKDSLETVTDTDND